MVRTISACILAFLVSLPLQARNKNDSVEEIIIDAIRDEIDVDKKGDEKNKGRPDNPGEHGRENASKKQCQNPGKGSKCDGDWAEIIRDEVEGDKKGKGKHKNK